MLEFGFWIGVTAAGIGLAAPVLYAGLGGLISERSGVLNIGLEGLMLFGAFGGAAIGVASGSAWVGFLSAPVIGAILGFGFAYLTISRAADQVVVGIGLNILALGATGYLLHRYPYTGNPNRVPGFDNLFGGFADAVSVGRLVKHTAPELIVFFLVPIVWWVLYRTNWGLVLRACGDDPESVDALGLNVVRIRYQAVIIGAALAAAGGAVLSLAALHIFVEGMTAGRGFLALAAYIFGKWSPLGTLAAALLFGFGDALQLRLQTLGVAVPYELMVALPYFLGILALMGLVGRSQGPKAVGSAFIPDRSHRRRDA
jgi:simple sugar transport system permease protein